MDKKPLVQRGYSSLAAMDHELEDAIVNLNVKNTLQCIIPEEPKGLGPARILTQLHCFNSVVDHNVSKQLNANSQLGAAKFVTLMLTRLWRRRRAEVDSLHAQSHKFWEQTDRIQNELHTRTQMILTEQRRGDQLSKQLKSALNRVRITSYCCTDIDTELKQLRESESVLRRALDARTQECENLEELFAACKKELFRELAQFRQSSQLLANEERRALQLELLNTELNDELLAIRYQFQSQTNTMLLSLSKKQKELDVAYEALNKSERALATLRLKHNELIRLYDSDLALQQRNADAAKNLRFIQNVLFFATHGWGTLYSCWYHISSCFLDYLMPVLPTPSRPEYTVRLCLALVLLLVSLY